MLQLPQLMVVPLMQVQPSIGLPLQFASSPATAQLSDDCF
jgi:hypothetical protein